MNHDHPSMPSIRFCPLCGTPTVNKPFMGETRPTCPSCNWVHFTDPKVAVVGLIEKDDQILLVQRIYEPHKGEWSLPGGFLNAFEDPQRALQRELLEEAGLEIQVKGLLDVLTGRDHPRGADIVIVYAATVTGGVLCAGDDASQAAFFSRRKLPPLAFESTKKVLTGNS